MRTKTLLLVLSFFIPIVHAQRYALVIGNSNYPQLGHLKNPVNDATDMAKLLARKGFKVTVLSNANKRKMQEAINKFTRQLYQKNAVGLFYFAGHGMQIDGTNFLIPVNPNISTETDVEFNAVNAGRVLAGMRRAGNQLNMVILDACRNNPYKRGFRDTSRGLAKMDAAKGTLILYAASVGELASDGSGRNGLFTERLMRAIEKPELKVEDAFKQAALDVYQASQKKQLPWQSGVILGDFYFTVNAPNAKTVTVAPLESGNKHAEIVYWESIKTESKAIYFQSYLKKYPQGLYADLAQLKINNPKTIIKASQEIAHLTVKTSPQDALIRILNIKPKYQSGIKLKPGSYQIEVSKAGFKRHTEWVELAAADDKMHSVVLQEKSIPVVVLDKMHTANTPHMVNIPAGCFQMGSPEWEKERDDDERQHEVCLERFQLGAKEVTVTEFRCFIMATGYRTEAGRNIEKPGCYAYNNSEKKWDYQEGYYWDKLNFSQNNKHPVACVSWNDVQKYISWLNQKTGGNYRLPTEAEWEYGARAGSQTAYYWSNVVDAKACLYANVNDKNWKQGFPCDDGYKFTTPVGKYRSNDFGLYDMTGNIWEWTCSTYDKAYQGAEKKCLGIKNAKDAVLPLRGGSFDVYPRGVRLADRRLAPSWFRNVTVGFRLARTY